MRTAAVAFLLSTAVAAGLTPLLRAFARQRGLLDHALTARKIHGRPVPRLGGLAIVAAFYAPIAGLFLIDQGTGMGRILLADQTRALALLGGGLCVAALGLYDDLRGAGAFLKFGVQVCVAMALWKLGFRIEHLATPFGAPVPLGSLALPITVLWMVGVVNAMNLIDGLDGLAGGVALFALGTTFAIAFVRGEAIMALFAAALSGGVVGFLFYNFNPASIFMGDTGSMFLGFVLAASSIWTNQKSSTAVALIVPVVALGLPIADTVLAIARRALHGRPLFSADKEHIHHRLLALGLSQRQAVMVLYGACTLLGLSALVLSYANSAQTALVLSALSVVGFFAVRKLGVLQRPGPAPQPARTARAAVRELSARLFEAQSQAQLWEASRPFAQAVGAARMSLAVHSPREHGERVTTLWQLGEGPCSLETAFAVGDDAGRLELGFADGRTQLERDQEIASELLCDHLAEALERLFPRAQSQVIQLPGREKRK